MKCGSQSGRHVYRSAGLAGWALPLYSLGRNPGFRRGTDWRIFTGNGIPFQALDGQEKTVL